MNFDGVILGVGTFLIIGILHPVIIKTEYFWGARAWPLFLIAGVFCEVLSLFLEMFILSALSAVAGFAFLWSILELFEQKKRVAKGWFPKNPNKK
jgi:hypothetical protein